MTLFRYLIVRDVNYPISLQTPMLDEVTSFLLPRNVQNTCNNVRYILNKNVRTCTKMKMQISLAVTVLLIIVFVHGSLIPAFLQWKTDKSNFSN